MGFDFMYNISLDEKGITFKDIEKKIYKYVYILERKYRLCQKNLEKNMKLIIMM